MRIMAKSFKNKYYIYKVKKAVVLQILFIRNFLTLSIKFKITGTTFIMSPNEKESM